MSAGSSTTWAEVPQGAVGMLLGAYDHAWTDNTDPDGDFRIRIRRFRPDQ